MWESSFELISSLEESIRLFSMIVPVTEHVRGILVSFTTSEIPPFLVYFSSSKEVYNLPIGVIVAIALLGILCCLLGGVLLFICNRHGCCLRIGKSFIFRTRFYRYFICAWISGLL